MRSVVFGLMAVALFLLLLAHSASVLVVDQPRPADVIVVLAGETDKRPARGLDLLRQGFARHLIFDVPAEAKFFESGELDLARRYVQTLHDAQSIIVCPIYGFSTKAEAVDVSRCLKDLIAKRVLLVTSDYHTRRAVSTFKKEVVYDSQEFGKQWWRHREWAKTFLYESIRLAWWEIVDRWR
jgi:uncharacterized SAM-binding protein YcdF (DUF218 family)